MAGELAVTGAVPVGTPFPEQCEIYTGIAAAALTILQPVYQTSSGTYGVADANGSGTLQFRGVALEAVAAGQQFRMLKRGVVTGYVVSSSTPDAPLYLSDTAGSIATSAGSTSIQVGIVFKLADGTNAVYIEADYHKVWA